MKKALVFVFAAALATSAFAQGNSDVELNQGNGHSKVNNDAGKVASGGNLTYHSGGKVIRNAHVVMIFWGSFPSGYTTNMQNFRNQFGTTGEYNTITQYTGIDDATGSTGAIALSNLAGGPADYFDTSTPPTNVTDAIVQAKVKAVIAAQGTTDYSAIYEVFIPSGSYSSDGSSTSCGGPNLAYCAYHWYYTDTAGKHVKYSIEPWAGCSGCQAFGNTSLDQEHFVCHETREAVTDALGNAWFDRRGAEADDKCAWTPAPFIGTGGFGYQYEWSNLNSGCIRTR
jgi:adhesin HecA-like repeat protein